MPMICILKTDKHDCGRWFLRRTCWTHVGKLRPAMSPNCALRWRVSTSTYLSEH